MILSTRTAIHLLGLLSFPALAQVPQTLVPIDESVAEVFQQIASDERVRSSLQLIEAREPENVREQFRITEIPAPPFQEERRAVYYLEQMRTRGLSDAYIDTEGNAIGIRKGTCNGPTLLIAAHLDTVFT